VIEFNEVHNVVRESDDQGGMELYGNPTYRGVVFRYNRFQNCGNTAAGSSFCGQAAIRFDDAISGMLVYGNIFVRSANVGFGAVQINSGRDNVMDNNLFVDCKQGISGGYNRGNSVWTQAAANPPPSDFYLNALYLQRYPELATMLREPGVNHIWRNVFYHCGPVVTGINRRSTCSRMASSRSRIPASWMPREATTISSQTRLYSRRSVSGQFRWTRSASIETPTAPVGRWQ